MPRLFNGTTDTITAAAGGLSGFAFGAFVTVARRTNEAGWHGIVATQQSGGGTWEAYLDIAPSSHATASAIWTSWNGTDHANTLKFTQADGWCLIAVTKATGTATPRYHKYVCATQTWTHDNGVGAVPNATGIPGGNIIIGNVAGDQLAGDVAAVAMYGRTFTDQEIESLASSWEVWLSYGPMGAWLFDQAATGQTLLDWTGGGANQTAISGTTVTTGSLPVFNQSDGGTWAAEVISGGTTSVSVTDAATAADTATVTASASLADTAAGGDAIAVAVASAAADTAAASDSLSTAATSVLADAGAAADLLATLTTLALGEAAAGLDAVSVNTGATPISLTDAATASDAATLTAAVTVADPATAADGLGVGVAAGLADSATAADGSAVVRPLTVTDTAAAADSISTTVPPAVVTGTGGTYAGAGSSTQTTGTGGTSQWR